MQYCLLMHYQEPGEGELSDEAKAAGQAAFGKYADDLDAAGVLLSTHVLATSDVTTTYTARNGVPEIQDGPFADTKERLAGVFMIDVADLDAALQWAGRCPGAAWGSVEIRPVAITYTHGKGWHQP